MERLKFKNMNPGSVYEVIAIVVGVSEMEDKNGESFVQLVLGDGERLIAALKFKTTASELNDFGICKDAVVDAMISVKVYKEEVSYIVTSIKPASGEYVASDFEVKVPISAKNNLTLLMSLVKTCHTNSAYDFEYDPISDLTLKLLRKNADAFCVAPAGLYMHHNNLGGLLEHSLSVAQIAEMLSDMHSDLDKELLVCGAALHDIGKIKEMTTDTYGRTEYEPYGRLIGHSAIGINMIEKEAELGNYNPERVQLLQHMVASHHGNIHNGAISAPAVPEAAVLHALDMADGAVYKFNEVYKTLPEGSLSAKIPQLNNQYVYRAHPAFDPKSVDWFENDWDSIW